MRKFALILAIAFVISSLWAGIASADCKSNCESQLQTCDQGCQYIMNEEFKPFACSIEISFSRADAYQTLTLTGTLVRRFSIGGETTGWAIKLNIPLRVMGKTLDIIEVDSGNINMPLFENDTVKITGNLVKRTGIERGLYWVIEVKSIILCES